MAGPRRPNIGASPYVFEMLSCRCYSMRLAVASGICGVVQPEWAGIGVATLFFVEFGQIAQRQRDRAVIGQARFLTDRRPFRGPHRAQSRRPRSKSNLRPGFCRATTERSQSVGRAGKARQSAFLSWPQRINFGAIFFGQMRLVSDTGLFGFQFLLNAQARRFPHPGAGGSWRKNPNKTANKGHLL
jgi:hypothetical protein